MLDLTTFPSALRLGSTNSAGSLLPLFARFIATTQGSDFSRPFIIGLWLLAFPMRTIPVSRMARREISRLPYETLLDMPGSWTTPGRSTLANSASRVLPSTE